MHWVTTLGIFLIFLGTIFTYTGQNLQAVKNVKKEIIRSDDLLSPYIAEYEELITKMHGLYIEGEDKWSLPDTFPFPATSSILLEITDHENGRLHLGKHRLKLNDSYLEKQKRIFDSIKYSFLKIDFDNFTELGKLFSDYIVYIETSNPDKIHEIINDDFQERIIHQKGYIVRQSSKYYTVKSINNPTNIPPAFNPYILMHNNINYHLKFFNEYKRITKGIR